MTPDRMTAEGWDVLAECAKWSRKNSDVLADVHWIGGDPGEGEVYGWASWQPVKGIIVVRNPSDSPREFITTLKEALELPDGAMNTVSPKIIYPHTSRTTSWPSDVGEPFSLTLQPFEVLVIEL